MTVTAPPPVTPLPPAPSTDDPDNFDPTADDFVAAQQPWSEQLQTLGENVFENATEAFNAAVTAVAANNSAQAAAVSAAAATSAVAWAPGNYPQAYTAVFSLIDGMTYRNLVPVMAGTIDPALDDGNTWAPISGISFDDAVAIGFFF